MKNLLKKLGVLSLIITIITPYIYIPKVEAAANEDCTQHLVNYMFLESGALYSENNEDYFTKHTSAAGGVLTYGVFPYHFSADTNEKIYIRNVEVNNVPKGQLENYWTYYNTAIEDKTYPNYVDDINTVGKVFVEASKFNKNYDTNTLVFHGLWGRDYVKNEASEEKVYKNNIENTPDGRLRSMQYKLSGTIYDSMKVEIGPAVYNASKDAENDYKTSDNIFDQASMTGYSDFEDYFQSIIDEGNNVYTDNDGNKYIPLSIRRTFNNLTKDAIRTELNQNYKFGYKVSDTTTKVFSTSTSEILNSYTAYTNGTGSSAQWGPSTGVNNIISQSDFFYAYGDAETSTSYYWPAILNVEYEICPINNETPSEGKWVLKYDSNVPDDSVTNMPSSKDAKTTESITIDSKIPKRTGYVFKGWCTKKDGSGTCKKAGDKYSYPGSSPVTLYANWQLGDTVENPEQGVVSYIIGFISVALVAGGIYYISKKKNVFKQI